MKIVHLSDVHIWRYTWNVRRLMGVRAYWMAELPWGAGSPISPRTAGSCAGPRARPGTRPFPDHGRSHDDRPALGISRSPAAAGALLDDPLRVTMVPGNHDRTTRRSFRTRRFEGTFGEFMPPRSSPGFAGSTTRPRSWGWIPSGPILPRRGRLPEVQLGTLRSLTADPEGRPTRLIIACHYPVAAPAPYQEELAFKRMDNDQAVTSGSPGSVPISTAADMSTRPGRSSPFLAEPALPRTPGRAHERPDGPSAAGFPRHPPSRKTP